MSETTSIGSRPAKSPRSRTSRAPAACPGSGVATPAMLCCRSRTRRGVKPVETRARMRVCLGGSSARNDIVRWACGPQAAGSSETPFALENLAGSRNAVSHVGVPGQRPEVLLVVAVQRRKLAQPGVRRIRVLVDRVVVRAEGHRTRSATGYPMISLGRLGQPVGHVPVGVVAEARLHHRTEVGELEQAGRRAVRPGRDDNPRWISRPIFTRNWRTSGSLPNSAAVQPAASSGSSETSSASSRSTATTLALAACSPASYRRQRVQPPPENLAEQVVLGGEVRVGGGRRRRRPCGPRP